jgi:hypothetical protein
LGILAGVRTLQVLQACCSAVLCVLCVTSVAHANIVSPVCVTSVAHANIVSPVCVTSVWHMQTLHVTSVWHMQTLHVTSVAHADTACHQYVAHADTVHTTPAGGGGGLSRPLIPSSLSAVSPASCSVCGNLKCLSQDARPSSPRPKYVWHDHMGSMSVHVSTCQTEWQHIALMVSISRPSE